MPNGPYRKKRFHRGDPLKKKFKTKKKTKDLDEVGLGYVIVLE